MKLNAKSKELEGEKDGRKVERKQAERGCKKAKKGPHTVRERAANRGKKGLQNRGRSAAKR